ncbi:MAG: transcriptional repressor [Tannerellaceae bacterium]|jgi:Fur family ferric uptake transcriptional regulator|nr:transcriptional repressor [Tannerellaceae bacterium]
MMEDKIHKEVRDSFYSYLKEKHDTDKGRRKTEERDTILDEICNFKGHFDINMLQSKLNNTRFHVSKATLYNTLNVLIDAGLIVRHHFDAGSIAHRPHSPSIPVMYELRRKADTHLHFICTQCHSIQEVKNPPFLKEHISALKNRFAPDYFSSCVYGTCKRCKNRVQKEVQENNRTIT